MESGISNSANIMKTYIHVGYPKNASTTLQMDIFPNIKGASYLGRIYNSEQPFISKELSEAVYAISMQDSIEFSYQEIEKKIQRSFRDINIQNDKLVISWEAFSHNVADRKLIAERLNKLFPDANILVIIRNQMDALQSMYAFLVCQMGKNINVSYGRPSISSFEKWISEQEDFLSRSYISTLRYYEFISEYWDLFGKERVTVLLFEELAKFPELFFEKMALFLDTDCIIPPGSPLPRRNTKPTNKTLLYYKLRNRFPQIIPSRFLPGVAIRWARVFFNSGAGARGEKLPLEMQERLMNMYRESNRKLQQELGIDLGKHGYVT